MSNERAATHAPKTDTPAQLRFTFLVQWSDEDEAFVATSPEWPGLSFVSDNRLLAIAQLETLIVEACRATVFDGEAPPTPLVSGEAKLVPTATHVAVERDALKQVRDDIEDETDRKMCRNAVANIDRWLTPEDER